MPSALRISQELSSTKLELKLELKQLCSKLECANNLLTVIFVVGHPGTGKTTLTTHLEKLDIHPKMAVFHADDFINWKNEVRLVLDNGGTEKDIMPAANSKALSTMLDLHKSKRVVIWDGGGLIKDFSKISSDYGIASRGYIVIDCSPQEFKRRLLARLDSRLITDKNCSERQENLNSLKLFPSTIIDTTEMNLKQPIPQLSQVIAFIAKILEKQ